MKKIEQDVNSLIDELTHQYHQFIGKMRGTTGIDGLKTVHRRSLYAFSTIKTESAQSCKTARLVGEVVGKYHPHAESGTVDAITTLVIQKFIKREGNWGNFFSLASIKPAAIRYTSVKWNKEIFDPIFENIDNVPFLDGEIGFKEPEYLPVMIPLCLINTTYYNGSSLMFGVSPGISTNYPLYNIQDLVKFIREGAKTNWTSKFIPDPFFGENVKIVTMDGTYKDLFDRTSMRIKIEAKIEANPKTREVVIKAFPKKPSPALIKVIKSKATIFVDKSKVDYTELYIKFSRSNYYEEFLPKLKAETTITKPINIVINYKDTLYNTTIREWLKSTYIIYKRLTIKTIADKIEKLDVQINELNLIKLIQPHVKASNSVNGLLKLTKAAGLDDKIVIDIISKYPIKRLLTFKTDTSELKSKRHIQDEHLKNIDDYMITLYDKLASDSKKIFKIGAK